MKEALEWRWLRQFPAWVLVLAAWIAVAPAWAAAEFLEPEKAFRLAVQEQGAGQVQLQWTIAPGYYLYRNRIGVSGTGVGAVEKPRGEVKEDPNFGTVEVYHEAVQVGVQAGTASTLRVTWQGCADEGLCYPPVEKDIVLASTGPSAAAPSAPVPAASTTGASTAAIVAGNDADISRLLSQRSLAWTLPLFFVLGIGLAFTPCVLPMVPILSSIIVGQKDRVSRGRGFALALAYSQGMALVYTALGVAAGLLGQGLAAYLQHPWVVLAFAALMVVLALSMFGLYELRLPVAVQSWLGEGTRHLPGGRFVSVFAMGVVSALIVSPCVSAPLAGALLYISQTRDVVLGGTALYAMAWGMSLPLLLVGLSAGSLLPRTGPWMTAVKAVFGVLMLGMALWVARPAWPYVQTQWLGQPAAVSSHQSVLPFERVRSVAELDAALARAQADGKPVMLDFYADWCTSCIEMERETFSDPLVQDRLRGVVLLQADVTLNSAEDRALLQRFQLFGPPGLILFDPQGRELSEARVIGFQAPQAFLRSLQNAGW